MLGQKVSPCLFAEHIVRDLKFTSDMRKRHSLLRVIMCVIIFHSLSLLYKLKLQPGHKNIQLIVATLVTKETVFYEGFLRSAQINGLSVRAMGKGKEMKGFGVKLLELKKELENFKDNPNTIFLYADAYDVLFNANEELILQKFLQFDAKILFSAETNCSPRPVCAIAQYPTVERGKRYLNAGLFMGFAPELYRLITSFPLEPEDDDQLFCSKIYANEYLRSTLNIKLDHLSQLFMSTIGPPEDVQIIFKGRELNLFNPVDKTWPLIMHEPGPKVKRKAFDNYMSNVWNPVDGCIACLNGTRDLSILQIRDYPSVIMAIFVKKGALPLDDFFGKLKLLSYPKKKIHLFIYNSVKKIYRRPLDNFIRNHGEEYYSMNFIDAANSLENDEIISPKDLGMEECLKWKCDYFFNVDSSVILDNSRTLQLLIEQNRKVVAPILFSSDRSRVNIQGIVARDEHCPSSLDIIKNNRSGLWTVSEVSACYLIDGSVILNPQTKPIHSNQYMKAGDASFSEIMGIHDIELYASNRFQFGHLV